MAEQLWDGGPLFSAGQAVFPLSTDSILLSDFARPGKSANILDLGTGSGILALLLLFGHPERRALGVDISPKACALARKNLKDNRLSAQCEILEGDLTAYRALLPSGGFDYAVSNPPYFSAGSGKPAEKGLADARADGAAPLSAICRAAGWGLRWGGDFSLCFRPERLSELIWELKNAGLEPKRLRTVRHGPSTPVSLLLLEARRGGKPGLRWEPELILQEADGAASAEYRRIYHLESGDGRNGA